MDYILIPKKAQHIAVPYKCTELYDEDDFMTYPDRKRWTAAQIRGENGYGGRKLEVESFVQTWLYFGCLLEVFKIGGIHVTTEDFVDRERGVVTAKKLPSLFVEWRKRWPKPTPSRKCNCGHYINPFEVKCRAKRCWKTFKHGRFSPEYHSIKSILEEVCQTIGHYCHSEGVAGKPRAIVHVPSPEETPIAPEIVTSIVALGYTLHTAILDIYDIPSHQWRCHWGGTPLLRRLLKTKWCPLQVTSMMTELAIDGHYYLTTIPGPPEAERQTHANCTDEQCVAKGIDEATYVTKHITGKECCDHISVPDELFEIVGRKGAPIVSWVQETDDQKFRLTVTEHNVKNNKTPKYIAISHVWSDGMGNPNKNSLPECQLSRIQRMVDGVSFPGRQADEHVGFWMDTLCIPVPEKGMGEEERKKRKELRKFCIVNMRHIYESASAVLVLESSLQEISTSTPIADKCVAIYQTKWRRRLWTFQEGALTQQLYFQFTDKSQHAHDLMDRTLEKKDSLKAKGIYTALLPNTISAAIAAIRILSGVDEGSIDTNRWMLLLSVAGEFCSRQTSRTTDETLCASTVLGIDPSPFVEIEEDDEHDELMVADLRMELLFRRLGKIQSFIIFNTRPRLKKEGFRWAPRSWMGGAADDIGGSSGADEEYGDASIRQWGAGASDVGLQVVFRAIGLRSIPNGFDAGHRKFVVMDKKKSMRCSVQLVPDELGQYPVWETGSNYVLVLARELSAPDALGCVAVLGRLLLPLGQVRHECLAWVELQADSKTFDIAGEFTQQCMWIIV